MIWLNNVKPSTFFRGVSVVMDDDIAGKVMVPIVESAGGRHEANVLGRHEKVRTEQLGELEKRIRFNGFYPYRCGREKYERLEQDRGYRERTFERIMADEVRR